MWLVVAISLRVVVGVIAVALDGSEGTPTDPHDTSRADDDDTDAFVATEAGEDAFGDIDDRGGL